MIDSQRLRAATATVRGDLLAECEVDGSWRGRLTGSPAATAAALSALSVARQRARTAIAARPANALSENAPGTIDDERLDRMILAGLHWLVARQNADGGWGDSDRSPSNLAATLMVRAAFQLTGIPAEAPTLVDQADAYLARLGGVRGLKRRAIVQQSPQGAASAHQVLTNCVLAHCALAGMISWQDVPSLAFEMDWLPHRLTDYLHTPEPSWARSPLIAAGLARLHQQPPLNPLLRIARRRAAEQSLEPLAATQTADGSFMGGVVPTSFVVMCLAGAGRADHPVVRRAIRYLLDSSCDRDGADDHGCWPIETDRSTHVTSWAISALLGDRSTSSHRSDENDLNETTLSETTLSTERSLAAWQSWLLEQQSRSDGSPTVSEAAGWSRGASTDAAPNAADTAAALLALAALARQKRGHVDSLRFDTNQRASSTLVSAASSGIDWLLESQDDDGGWPVNCCKDDGDAGASSAADITAQCVRALKAWAAPLAAAESKSPRGVSLSKTGRIRSVIERAMAWLESRQQADGAWVPRAFGNQFYPREENPIVGTAQVLAAFVDQGRLAGGPARRGFDWLLSAQHASGGWGVWCRLPDPAAPNARERVCKSNPSHSSAGNGQSNCARQKAWSGDVPSIEETALAVEALLGDPRLATDAVVRSKVARGLAWLVDAVEGDRHRHAVPIGLHFSGLWYYEPLYPLLLTASALSAAEARISPTPALRPASIQSVR
ncbi:MAG: hypothetical protein K8T25_01280 [Planctomycetia bacterium]|nr:hypothetical protein [Planctomycetia bacterium]